MTNVTQEPTPETGVALMRSRILRAGNFHWLHWLVIGLSFVLTVSVWWISQRMVQLTIEERFSNEADRVVDMVVERMGHYEDALWGGVALFDGSEDVTYDEWVTYTDSTRIVERYPGINGLGVINYVPEESLSDFLVDVHKSQPEFQVHPEHDNGDHWPITFIEPADLNQAAIGLDMGFETNRRSAIEAARDSGQARVTGPIVLAQDSKKTPGFLFYAPFFEGGAKPETPDERRRLIRGVTYAPFVVSKLLRGTLSRQNRKMHLQILDADQVLFDDLGELEESGFGDTPNAADARLRYGRSVEMYGRNWDFELVADPDFAQSVEFIPPSLILIGGIVIDGLLILLFWLLSRSNKRAVQFADLATQDLLASKKELERSNQDLEQFAYVASHDLKAPLRAIGTLSGWLREDLEPILDGSEPITEELREGIESKLELLRARTARMQELMNSLLTYARISSGEFQQKEVDLEELVEEVSQLCGVEDRFDIVVDQPLPAFQSEKVPLEVIFQNLISNAIKHHDQDRGVIRVSGSDDEDHYTFSVTDDGPGIDPRYSDKIFDLFSTLQSRDQVEGSGMGLAFIKKIVQDRRCSVWLEPNPDDNQDGEQGRGATIRFTWPKVTQ